MRSVQLRVLNEKNSTNSGAVSAAVSRWSSRKELCSKTVFNKRGDGTTVEKELSKVRNKNDFFFFSDDFEVSLGYLGGQKLDDISITCDDRLLDDDLIHDLIFSGDLVHGTILDVKYTRLENETDISYLKAIGYFSDCIVEVTNGLPEPLHEMVADTSSNPGRIEFSDDLVSMVGAKNWFGPKFFTRSKAVVEELNSLTGFEVCQLGDGIISVNSETSLFFDRSTKEQQNRLRNALF